MANNNSVSRSLSTASLDGWVDIVPTAGRSRKPSIDSMSSWCFAGDEVVEPDMNELAHDELPIPPMSFHMAGSRRGSLASWDGDGLLFERSQACSSNSSGGSVSSGGNSSSSSFGNSSSSGGSVVVNNRRGSEMGGEEREGGPEWEEAQPQRGRAQRQRAQEDEQWVCAVCSFFNHPLMPRCEMCDHVNGTPPPVQAAVQAGRSFASVVRQAEPGVREASAPSARTPKRRAMLRAPRVRPDAGIAFMSRCRSTLLSSLTGSHRPSRKPRFPSQPHANRMAVIAAIPEEDEEAVEKVLQQWSLEQRLEEEEEEEQELQAEALEEEEGARECELFLEESY